MVLNTSSLQVLYDVILQIDLSITKSEDTSYNLSAERYFSVMVNKSMCLTLVFKPSVKCSFILKILRK